MKQCMSLTFTLSLIIFTLSLARAEKVGDLVTFSPETPASASEVNQNFTNITTAVNNNDDLHIEDVARITANEAAIALLISSVTISAVNFAPANNTQEFSYDLGDTPADDGGLSIPVGGSAPGRFAASVTLPAGVIITGLEASVLDNSPNGDITISLRMGDNTLGSPVPILITALSSEGVPGVTLLSDLTLNETVLSGPSNYYWIDVLISEELSIGLYSTTIHYRYP